MARATKRKVNIALTGLHAPDGAGAGMSVIRALKESAYLMPRIIGLAHEPMEPGIYLHEHIDRAYQIPYPSANSENLFNRIEYIHSKERLDVLIPNFIADFTHFIKLEPKLRELGIASLLPTMHQFEDRQKARLSEFGRKHNVKVPATKAMFSISEINNLHYEFAYPVVLKGKYRDADVAYTAEQARTYFNRISNAWGLPVIVQQFIHGDDYKVAGLGDGKGNLLAAVPICRQSISENNKVWSAMTVDESAILKLTGQLVHSSRWKGCFELELRKDKTDQLYLLEVSPRVPEWISLPVSAGQNIPEALVRLALGESVEPSSGYDIGKRLVRYSCDLIVEESEIQTFSTSGEL
jgi:carbamoyl-phosphate synthase large subunit